MMGYAKRGSLRPFWKCRLWRTTHTKRFVSATWAMGTESPHHCPCHLCETSLGSLRKALSQQKPPARAQREPLRVSVDARCAASVRWLDPTAS